MKKHHLRAWIVTVNKALRAWGQHRAELLRQLEKAPPTDTFMDGQLPSVDERQRLLGDLLEAAKRIDRLRRQLAWLLFVYYQWPFDLDQAEAGHPGPKK